MYAIPQHRSECQLCIRSAAKWLAAYTPRTGEERAMRVLGMAWANTEKKALGAAGEQLLSPQRPDDGWAQLDTLPSDAYATGQALYALNVAGRLPALQTQLADGSWHIQSRSYPIRSNYFDTGF